MGSKPKGLAGLNQKVTSECSLSPPGSLSGLCLLFWTFLWSLPTQEPSTASTPSDLQPQQYLHYHALQRLSSPRKPLATAHSCSPPAQPSQVEGYGSYPISTIAAISQPLFVTSQPCLRPSGALNISPISHSPPGLPGPPVVRGSRAGSAFPTPDDSFRKSPVSILSRETCHTSLGQDIFSLAKKPHSICT